uniref:Uncharacterized protein n=1 Tax=Vitis vinifera TaxID=29760 RepID=A5BNS9_VITVI|nr:hypothetical protein VITISV_030311 [Vitis vinifera]
MLSMSFSPHIINYDPPRGFMVLKFSTYDGTNDPFDHIMHYKQLMTLDIGNGMLLCKGICELVQANYLQIFKRNIYSSTPFFESLTKKPPTTMDDLFKRANKYSMLDDDIRAATQQVLVTSRPTRNDSARCSKTMSQRRQPPPLGGEVNKSQASKTVRPLRGKMWEGSRNPATTAPTTLAALRDIINYIYGAPVDEKYNSKRKRKISIQLGLPPGGMRPIDGVITFPPVDPNRVLQPHEDALILTLGINDFDFNRPVTDVRIQTNGIPTINSRKSRTNTIRIQWSFNYLSGRCRATRPSRASYPECAVLNGGRLVPFQPHHGVHMTAWHEGRTYQPLWKPVGCTPMLSDSTRDQIRH